MPQMSPLNWMFLYIFMLMILILVILILSYMIFPENKILLGLNKNVKSKMNWMW